MVVEGVVVALKGFFRFERWNWGEREVVSV